MKKLIVAVAALALMAGSAYAADWEFYGQAKIYTGWSDINLVDTNEGDSSKYEVQYSENLYTTARIGANVKVSDELSGGFEYGANDGVADVRLLYGVWNFGAGTLLVGKSYTPLNVAYSNQIFDNDLQLEGFGDFYNARRPELMLTFGGFSIAVLDPQRDAWVGNGTNDDLGYYDTQAVIPMIAMCYKATFDMGEVQIAGGYNNFEINSDENIDAYAVGLGAKLNFGAFGVFGTVVWGQNMGNLGTSEESGYQGLAIYDGNDVYDCESMGGTIGVTFAVNDMLILEAGYGYIHGEFDNDNGYVADTSIAQTYYLQAAVTLAPGVTVTPEVGMIDQRETGSEETMYFGAAWKIAF